MADTKKAKHKVIIVSPSKPCCETQLETALDEGYTVLRADACHIGFGSSGGYQYAPIVYVLIKES